MSPGDCEDEASRAQEVAIQLLREYINTRPPHYNGLCSWLSQQLSNSGFYSYGYAIVGGASAHGETPGFGMDLAYRSLRGRDGEPEMGGPVHRRLKLAACLLRTMETDHHAVYRWCRAFKDC